MGKGKRKEDGRLRLVADVANTHFAARTLVLDAPREGRASLGLPAPTFRGFHAADVVDAGELLTADALLGRETAGAFDAALVFLPKGRERRGLTLDFARAQLRPGGKLALVGTKPEGIKGARKDVDARGERMLVQVGHHAQLLVVEVPDPGATSWPWSSWEDPDLPLPIWSLPGVFAHGRLDDGSRALLGAVREHADIGGWERVLDVAAGAGVLGTTVARWRQGMGEALPELWLLEADILGVAAAAKTAAEANIPAEVRASDGYAALGAKQNFDVVLCNPPFHRGVATEYSVADRLIRGASDHLRRGGELWLVANRFLAYQDALNEAFAVVEERLDDGRFRVWRAVR